MTDQVKKPRFLKKLTRIVLKSAIALLLFVILLIVIVHTPPFQNYMRKKTISYLEKKLNTKVEIGLVRIALPKNILLEDVYIEDQQQDTLIAGGTIRADINFIKLLSNNVQVDNLHLQDITAKVKRILPDTAFNFQFVIDAFTREKRKDEDTAVTAPLKLALDFLTLDNFNVFYKDVITGDDMTIHVNTLSAKIDTLDPYAVKYSIPLLQVDGLVARLGQVKPLVEPEPIEKDIAEASRQFRMDLRFGEADLKNIDIEYKNDVSAFYTQLKFGALKAVNRQMDLTNRIIHLDIFTLEDALTSIHLGRKAQARLVEKEVEQEIKAQSKFNWNIQVDKLDISDNEFVFDNENSPRQGYGMDYGHLRAEDLDIHLEDFIYSPDSIGGNIKNASFKEQGGFNLQELRAEVLYAHNQAYLQNLYLRTPGTELKRYASLSYASYYELAHDFPSTQLEADISDSYVQVKDILAFAPQLRYERAFSNPEARWYIDFQGRGTVSSLHIDNLQFQGLESTVIDASGTLATGENPNQVGGTLFINRLHTTQSDIALFTGIRLSTRQLKLPEEFDVRGKIAGTLERLNTDLNIATSMGNANIQGQFTSLTRPANATYTAVIRTNSLHLGRMLMNDQVGRISANMVVSGVGFGAGNLNTKFRGNIYSVLFNDYTYRNIYVNGNIKGSGFNIKTSMNDPNIDLEGMLTGTLTSRPSLHFVGKIDSLKTLPLGITPQTMVFKGNVDADIPLITADQLEATILITDALFVSERQRLPLDTVLFIAGRNDSIQFMDLTSDVATAHLSGKFRYADLGKIFRNSIQPYFSISPVAVAEVQPYDINFRADISGSPLLTAFVPGLTTFEEIHTQGSVVTGQGLTATLTTGYVLYNDNEISGLDMNITTTPAGLKFEGQMQRLRNNTFNIYRTEFNATALNNVIDFNLNVHDVADKDKYYLSGMLRQPQLNTYTINLRSDSLMLNYEMWMVSADNSLTITRDNIAANNFIVTRGDQQLSLQTIGDELQTKFTNFQISTITGFMKADSLMINGTMTGTVNFRNILRQPLFTSDLAIANLSFKGDTVGNAVIQVKNQQGRYITNATISGRGNDISLTGTLSPSGRNDIAMNLDLNLRQIQLATIEGVFGGLVRNASGSVNGNIHLGGTMKSPVIDGPINFDKASFAISILGSQFRIEDEQLRVTQNGFRFDDFYIRDTANNLLRLNGNIQTPNFTNFYFNLDVDAENFKILNTTRKDNKIYYGELVISTNLHIDGTEQHPIVDGDIAVNDGTELTVVIPQRQPGVIDREGIVEFVDLENPYEDSLFRAYDSLNVSDIIGMDISTNIEIRKEAVFNIVLDEANGDFINLQGEAQLSTGIDPSGKITLVGTYELERGSYEITFNFLHRRFEIQRGSRIIWLDRPTNATLDLKAVYIANTSPIDLVQSQISAATPQITNTYRQKLPFEIHLTLTGQLLQPVVAFDIQLPTDRSYGVSNDIIIQVESRLSELRNDPGEINKQVFSLLLLNRFVGPDPFESGSPAFSASNYVRQSVSRLLTSQLNRLASGLVDGVDITFDITSTDDYTTGERRSRTDLNIGLSKRLLNERLTVTIGSNYELQGPRNSNQQTSNVIGDLSLTYAISRDGRYLLRFYRKNEYEGVVDGYIIETGLGFLISVDYDKFRELLRRRKNQRVSGVRPFSN